ncbi:hypothetical protein [Geobacter hydrogenophilus]|uniref:hypothetical protein n=1 Tax=Geobacter hydrogenophilus TaxID=40983 RepID=UPI001BDAB5BB|nr:hypothetical protein [Geobacter hydrogenophilus]
MLTKTIDPTLASRADSVEMVYTDGKFSHLEYGFTEQRQPASYTPPSTVHRIAAPSLVTFGPCDRHRQTLKRTTAHSCGFIIDIASGKNLINLLPFDTLVINGSSKGKWTVALADDYLSVMEENYPIGEINEKGKISFSLDQAATHLDLKRTKYVAFILESSSGDLNVDSLDFFRTPSPPPSHVNPAMWVWDNRPAKTDASSMVSNLKALRVRRIYLQISDELEPLVPFIRESKAAGIEVFALDGSPSYLDHPEPLLRRIQLVKEFNSKYPGTPFAGFQIDIEPHLNKDFRIRLDTYGSLYIELLDRIRRITKEDLPLSTVIPFWYDSLLINDRSLAWHLFRQSDEVVIMSYRTDVAEIEAIARDELLYGERLSKKVLLGVETGRIPDEVHITFKKCLDDTPTAVEAGKAFWCRSSDYTVPGSRISFNGKEDAFKKQLTHSLPYKSFSGWVIHSYETAPR